MTKEVMSITIKDGCRLVFNCFPNSLRHTDNLGMFRIGDRTYYVDSIAHPEVSIPHLYLCGWQTSRDNDVMNFEYHKDLLNELITFLKSFCADKDIDFILSTDKIVLGGL